MKRRVLILLVLITLVPMTTVMARNTRYAGDCHGRDCYASDSYNDAYATMKLGVFMPNDDASFLDDGFTIGGTIGHNLNRNVALEIGLDYTITDFDDDYGYYSYGYDDYGHYEDAYVTTLGIPVTAKFIVPLAYHVDLFVGAGLGLYFTDVEFDDGYSYGYYYDDDEGVDDTCLGFHTLIGADIRMNSNTALSMELKYTELDQDSNDDYYDDFELGGTTASVGIKFLF
ncbi:MAG TPA: outer membrane beta-barrel protein [Desulfomonilia bacterium]|nr:outer membrane beta-barrel protein [Desulfomonilia bacterium]